jgi:hypothetical protein
MVWYLTETQWLILQAMIALPAFGALILFHRVIRRSAVSRDFVLRAAVISMLFSILLFRVSVLAVVLSRREEWLAELDPVGYFKVLIQFPGPLWWWLVGLAAAVWAHERWRSSRALPVLLTTVFLLVQTVLFAVPVSAAYRKAFSPHAQDLDFVREYLSARRDPRGANPTVYVDWGPAHGVWIELRANSYFHLTQAVGVMFSRDTAIEAMRRARLAAPFELHRYNQPSTTLAYVARLMVDRIFEADRQVPSPSSEDLLRLCGDPILDFAIIKRAALPGEALNNGRVHIYDCRQLRSTSSPARHQASRPNHHSL